jgi:hypothetical protein
MHLFPKNIKLLKFLLFVTLFYLKIQKKYVIQFLLFIISLLFLLKNIYKDLSLYYNIQLIVYDLIKFVTFFFFSPYNPKNRLLFSLFIFSFYY